MKQLKIFLLIIFVSSINSLNQLLLGNSFDCNKVILAAVRAKQSFFYEEHSVRFIELSHKKLNIDMRCEIDVYQPMEIFNDYKKIKFKSVSPSPLSAYPRTKGYFLKGLYDDVIKFLEELSKYNTRMKILVIIMDKGFEDTEKLMKIAFEKFKMLNIAVLIFVNQEEFLCMRNPFSGNLNERKPEFKCWSMKDHEILQDEIKNFIEDRISNLQKYPLKIDVYDQPLLCKLKRDRNGNIKSITYSSCEIVNVLAKKLNFQPIYVVTDGSNDHIKNGSWTGAIGNLENDEMDIAYVANARIIADYKLVKRMLFLQPISGVKHKFVIRKLKNEEKIDLGFSEIDSLSEFLVIVILFLFPPLLMIFKKLESKFCDKKLTDGSFMTVISILLSVSTKHSLGIGNATRFILFGIILFNLIFASFFQSSITTNLETVTKKQQILTINQLIEEGYELRMPISLRDIYINHYGSKISDIMRTIAAEKPKPPKISNFVEGMNYVVAEKNKKIAMLCVTSLVMGLINQYSDNESHEELLEIVPETVADFALAPMTRKDSYFIEKFNMLILRYNEIGLYRFFLKQAMNDANHAEIRTKMQHSHEKSLINFSDLFPLINLYITLTIIAIFIFICETLWNFIKNKKTTIKKKKLKKVEIIFPYLP
ncbi:hypothetical protein PVAND_000986 [Polypedilum vanderplanki]|uniref:Ionotropic receptor n=1 Tax=Polypedilum vanderplanki TaxID=319348 RepID=A0A9J6BLJ9_POLVA|nr:hypothetical protein PVAND_000986 [Polypedilum vanderplanki]